MKGSSKFEDVTEVSFKSSDSCLKTQMLLKGSQSIQTLIKANRTFSRFQKVPVSFRKVFPLA